ncbi:MAG: NAD(P)H-hydrate dehydratase [Alphaproteobacteria bacterium]|nr:NAD(P)H-hydrate dehydratase [Alphaproteobacteria bacterium]
MDHRTDILTVSAMGAADRYAIQQGRSGAALMDAAGAGLARAIMQRWAPRACAVLCGPGNNGGDGWEAAVQLQRAGWPVSVFSLVDRKALRGDAARAAAGWTGPVEPLEECDPSRFGLFIDALFGAGLARPLDGEARRLAAACNARRAHGAVTVSADVPSGIDGDMARSDGPVFKADLTVTFHRLKPAHLLQPGRAECGEIVLVDIGVPDGWRDAAQPCAQINAPELWPKVCGDQAVDAHKHSRGRLCVLSGPAGASGAARLAGSAGLTGGAGFVTLLCPPGALEEVAAASRSLVARGFDPAGDFRHILEDHRASAAVLGPGAGVAESTRARVLAALETHRPLVLDADALTCFADEPDALFEAVNGPVVLTPHGGEFARLFPDLAGRDDLNKIEVTREAAQRSGAVIVHKGPDTVIAAANGVARVNVHASARLATAGTGDILAGLIGALLASGEGAFDAASAAVWIHGDAGRRCGPGATVETVLRHLPSALGALAHRRARMAALHRIGPGSG